MRTLLFMPYVVPFVAGVLVWNAMLGEEGWLNNALRFLGWSAPADGCSTPRSSTRASC